MSDPGRTMTATGPDRSGPDRGNVTGAKILDSDLVESTDSRLQAEGDGWTATDARLDTAALHKPHHSIES